MVQFEAKKIADKLTRIYGMNGEQMYLVEGSKRAVLIDTASGAGDLKAFVKTLTDLPVTVLITHGHGDHAMGAPQFEEVYMSFLDNDQYCEMSGLQWRKRYLSQSPKSEQLEDADFIPNEAYIPADQAENFHDLKDGDTFELGGITIEAVACPGHSPGSMMFLIRELRTLVTGDACAYFTMLHADSCLGLSTYEKNLEAVNRRMQGLYDRVLMSHGYLEASVDLMEQVLECIREVKASTDDKVPFGYMEIGGYVAKKFGNNGISAYARLDGKIGNLVYNPERIWE